MKVHPPDYVTALVDSSSSYQRPSVESLQLKQILSSQAADSHPPTGEAAVPLVSTLEKSHQLPFGELIQ